ncbi:MAG: hypothetical protein IJ418_14480 [Clostridia bacterium]|nr:hypothetical protein [Clostridia bacterium]
MTYFKHRRVQQPYQPQFQQEDAHPVDEDGDRVYTEADYALQEEADDGQYTWQGDFAEDADELPEDYDEPAAFDPFNIPAEDFDDGFGTTDELPILDGDPLSADLLTDEERAALRRSRWRLISGLMDFAGVIVGTAVILILIALLVSLLNWLAADLNQTFTLWQTKL